MGAKSTHFTYVSFEINFENLKLPLTFVLNVMFEIQLLSENLCLSKYMLYYTDDLSYNKVAIQSPIYPSSNTFYIARNAVDRNPSTCMRTEQIGRRSPYKTMWWKVDLGRMYSINSIQILFKNYDGFGMLVSLF